MKTKVSLLVLAVVVLVGGFFLLKPKPVQSPHAKSFELVVKNRKLVSGPATLSVNQNDDVTISITADEAEELHLHGYDKSVDLEPNKPAQLHFTANLSGNFPYELEHSSTEIGSLQVQPK